jgi:hypothetical protein
MTREWTEPGIPIRTPPKQGAQPTDAPRVPATVPPPDKRGPGRPRKER